jgi:hypothetical protein
MTMNDLARTTVAEVKAAMGSMAAYSAELASDGMSTGLTTPDSGRLTPRRTGPPTWPTVSRTASPCGSAGHREEGMR